MSRVSWCPGCCKICKEVKLRVQYSSSLNYLQITIHLYTSKTEVLFYNNDILCAQLYVDQLILYTYGKILLVYSHNMFIFFKRVHCARLKVHKIENFFDSDFGICVISLLVICQNTKTLPKNFLDWAIIGGGTMKKNFELGQIFFLLQLWTLNMTQY